MSYSVFVFPYYFVSVSCARLGWPSRQLLSARKYTVQCRIVHPLCQTHITTAALDTQTHCAALHNTACVWCGFDLQSCREFQPETSEMVDFRVFHDRLRN